MGLPFTADQFFGVFADYNRAFIVAVVSLWLASITILAHVSRDPSRRSSRCSSRASIPRMTDAASV